MRELAEQLNAVPKDSMSAQWGSMTISSNFITTHLEDKVSQYKKIFRCKKIPYESGLRLFIYSYPSRRIFELMKAEPVLRECRGIIMSPLGIRVRPFPVMPTIDWESIGQSKYANFDVTIKINGTMFTGLPVYDKIYHISKVGKKIKIPKKYHINIDDMVRDAFILGLTPIFEYVDDNNPLVLREKSGCYLVGLRSIRTGRMARSDSLIRIANYYGVDKLKKINLTDLSNIDEITDIEGIVLNDGETIIRSKTPTFRLLQRITAILRYNKKDDLEYLVSRVDANILKRHLTNREIVILERRKIL